MALTIPLTDGSEQGTEISWVTFAAAAVDVSVVDSVGVVQPEGIASPVGTGSHRTAGQTAAHVPLRPQPGQQEVPAGQEDFLSKVFS